MSDERDYLWRNVFASIRPWNQEEDGELLYDSENYLVFRIEIIDRGQLICQRHVVRKRDLEVPGAYTFILNKMVELIDKSLEDGGHRDPVRVRGDWERSS